MKLCKPCANTHGRSQPDGEPFSGCLVRGNTDENRIQKALRFCLDSRCFDRSGRLAPGLNTQARPQSPTGSGHAFRRSIRCRASRWFSTLRRFSKARCARSRAASSTPIGHFAAKNRKRACRVRETRQARRRERSATDRRGSLHRDKERTPRDCERDEHSSARRRERRFR